MNTASPTPPETVTARAHAYRAYGLNIASELPLPVLADGDASHAPEITISVGETPTALEQPQVDAPYFQAGGSDFLFFIEGIGRYHASGGNRIVVEPAPDADAGKVRLFLLGSVLGALLYQRGLLLLHGSAIDTPHGAMIFVGAQGEGKSTLAAHLHKRGYRLLSDDVCAIFPGDGFEMLPAFARIRLCADAMERLSDLETESTPEFDVDKFLVPLQQEHCERTRRVAGIHLLRSHDEGTVTVQPLRGFERLHQVVSNLYRQEYLSGLNTRGHVMGLAGGLANGVPFVEVRRPRDIARMDDVIAHLENYWQTMPVLGELPS